MTSRARASGGSRTRRPPRALDFGLRISHLSQPAVDPSVIASIVSSEATTGIRERVSAGMAGDDAMPGYAPSTAKARERKGLSTDRVRLEETGEMLSTLGKKGQSMKGLKKEGGVVLSWGRLVVKVGVGAVAARGMREVTRYRQSRQGGAVVARWSETQTVTVRADVERKAVLIQRWAAKNLYRGARDFLRTARETQRRIADRISSDARALHRVLLAKRGTARSRAPRRR